METGLDEFFNSIGSVSSDLPALDYHRGERWVRGVDRAGNPGWAPYAKQRSDETVDEFVERVRLAEAKANPDWNADVCVGQPLMETENGTTGAQ